jgi:hypothetical protein
MNKAVKAAGMVMAPALQPKLFNIPIKIAAHNGRSLNWRAT